MRKKLETPNFKMTMQFEQLNRMKTIFNALPSNFVTKEFVRVRITHSVSSEEFYIVKWQMIEDISRLHCNLFDRYSGKMHATIAAPEKGIICCVEFGRAWFRAIIDEIGSEGTCKVRLIDSGGIKWTPWSKLRVLEENFIEIPAYSAQCKLIDVEATKAQTEWFNTFCGNSVDVFVLINAMSSDGCCEVLLYSSNGCDYQCINRTIPTSTESSFKIDDANENRAGLSASSNRSRPEMIEILHMKSLDLFFIELEKDKAGIQRLLTDVQRYACSLINENAVINREWKIDDFCLVQVQRPNKSPHSWYRGKIIRASANRFKVYLRDEGVAITIADRLRIRPIDDRLCDVRNRAIKCRLSGIRPIQRHDNDDVANKFMEIVNKFDCLAVSVHEKPRDCILPVLLWGGRMKYDENLMLHFDWSNVNRLLVDKRLAERGENFELIDVTINDNESKERIAFEVENELENIEFVGEEIGKGIDFGTAPAVGHDEYDLCDEIETVDTWLPSDQIFKPKYVATVTYISTKCVIHVLDAYRRSVAETMQKKITDHVVQQKISSASRNTDWIKEVGQACFARFSDGNYYRASIRRICQEHEYCMVRFIDYGNVEICKMKYIHPAVLFGGVPTLTQTYIFSNVRPVYENAVSDKLGRYRWPKAVRDYCYTNLVDHRCVIHVIDDFSDCINTCELFRGENDTEFVARLVGNGMAAYIDTLLDE